MINFPGTLDTSSTLPNPSSTNNTNNPSHAGLHDNENAAIIALETKLGTGSSTPVANSLLFGTGAGTSAWTQLTSSQLASALADETGTGAAVFGISPTLVTPKVDTINENTTDNGVTIDGVNIKDGAINTAGAVGTTAIASGIQLADKAKNPYKFSAYANGSVTLTTSSPVKVSLNVKNYDTGSNFDNTTNYRFTAPVAGFYFFNGQVQIGNAGIGSTAFGIAMLYKNGSEVRRGLQLSGSGGNSTILNLGVNAVLQLAANDYIELFAVCSDNPSRTTGAGNNVTYLEGFLVSAT